MQQPVNRLSELERERAQAQDLLAGAFQELKSLELAMEQQAKKVAEDRGHARRMARSYEDLIHRLWRDKTRAAAARNAGVDARIRLGDESDDDETEDPVDEERHHVRSLATRQSFVNIDKTFVG